MTFWGAFIGRLRGQGVHKEITSSPPASGHTLHSPEAHQATHGAHINGTLRFVNVHEVLCNFMQKSGAFKKNKNKEGVLVVLWKLCPAEVSLFFENDKAVPTYDVEDDICDN